jgi:nucleolar protein 14
MTPEERMLERFTKERQRAAKGINFNLEDEEELTHYGQSLSNLDDFDNVGLGADDMDEDDDGETLVLIRARDVFMLYITGKIDQETVKRVHFGGFEDEEEEDGEDGEEVRRHIEKGTSTINLNAV